MDRPLLEFQTVRQHLFKDVVYRLRLYRDRFQIALPEAPSSPKYIVMLSHTTNIGWKSKMINDQLQLKGVIIQYNGKQKMFAADHDNLRLFKQIIGGRILYQQISTFYSPVYLLGEGSFARVVLCHSRASQGQYAVKYIKRDFENTNDFEGISNEAQIMTDLRDRYQSMGENTPFARLWEIYQDQKGYYFVMDYIRGQSLEEYIQIHKRSGKKIPPSTIKSIMRQLTSGVSLLHKQQIMHRDLKPENVMFSESNSQQNLKIIDFGLATYTNAEKYLFLRCGTPGYVAPEIFQQKHTHDRYNESCDIFSLGVIFYQLLTGNKLFYSRNLDKVLLQNRECRIDFEDEIFLSLQTEQLDLLRRMLHKNPQQRITAEQILRHPYLQECYRLNYPNSTKLPDQSQDIQTQKTNLEQFCSDRQISIFPSMKQPKLLKNIHDDSVICSRLTPSILQSDSIMKMSNMSFYQKDGGLSRPERKYINNIAKFSNLSSGELFSSMRRSNRL